MTDDQGMKRMPAKTSTGLLALLLALVALLIAACEAVPTAPPQITVVITAVSDQQALDDAVAGALTATAVQDARATETSLAQANISVTPSATPTSTHTPLPPTETPFLSPTPTPPPTQTLTPTPAPLASNTPGAVASEGPGRIRLLHAWRPEVTVPIDVLIDDVPVARDFTLGQSTAYQQVTAGTVRVNVMPAGAFPPRQGIVPQAPLTSRTIDVPAGGSVSVLVTSLNDDLILLPVLEDSAPLATGETRLNIVHANPLLLRVDLVVPGAGFTLANDMDIGDAPGPFDLPAGALPLQILDADNPELLLANLVPLPLDSRVSYLMVLIPPGRDEAGASVTDYLLFAGSTSHTASDTSVRFVNTAINAGPLTLVVDDELLVTQLEVGEATVPLPLSTLGSRLYVRNLAGREILSQQLGPWPGAENRLNKIILLTDAPPTELEPIRIEAITFFEEAPPSLTRSNLRLIHGLTGVTRTLDLEIRSTNPIVISNEIGVPQSQQADTAWSPVVQNVSYNTASAYAVRTPNLFDARLVLSGSTSTQAQLSSIELLPGGIYDFVALPGRGGQGVAQLLLLQPEVQVTLLGQRHTDPALIQEQIEAALTASAPAVTVTPTSFNTATPTITPVPTNTPRATNTPGVPIPRITVNPAPPNAVQGSFVLTAHDFAPGRRYTIRLDMEPENISGSIGDDGSLVLTVNVPANLAPGPHTVRICVDCRPGGAQQAAYAVFLVADRARTATPTPDR
jgi:hypothetical protein